MNRASNSESTKYSRAIVWSLIYALVWAPVAGCTSSESEDSAVDASAVSDVDADDSLTGQVSKGMTQAWTTISKTTESGLLVISEKCATGSQMALDASEAAWIWSSEASADGWNWIAENAGGATAWARDSAGQAWTVTKTSSDEFSLWVRVKTEEGVAWAKTALPAAWTVTKDATGRAFVWIDEHKVEVAVAAAVVAVVVAGLIVAPAGVAPAVVKGAVAGTSAETARFLTDLYQGRSSTEHGPTLQDVSHDLFLSIGKSVIGQCGAQAIGLGAEAA